MNKMKKHVLMLAACQAMFMTGGTLLITTSALVGYRLSPDKALATLPLAMLMLAGMLTSIPASLLMQRYGRRAGFLLGSTIGITGAGLAHFWLALFLLGVGWNFLFIGATTLLTETYTPEEKAKAQALNDFLVFSTVTLAVLSAGSLQHHLGWRAVNYGVIPLIAVTVTAVAWLLLQRRAGAVAS